MTKRCTICKQDVALALFETSRHGKYGRGSRCKACNALRRRARAHTLAAYWSTHDPYTEHPGYKTCYVCDAFLHVTAFARGRHERDGLQRACRKCSVLMWQQRKYGRVVVRRDNCEICLAAGKRARLGIDHDHTTGATRGVLCNLCNTALGAFHENVDVLRRAIAYLEHYKE